mmetsp:Transcript_61177/g.129186  ORF Transcript_61177/g.129186 Transcript_61177/m.129186 type:complete len:137 (-) Transcript_61177:235-645(-)
MAPLEALTPARLVLTCCFGCDRSCPGSAVKDSDCLTNGLAALVPPAGPVQAGAIGDEEARGILEIAAHEKAFCGVGAAKQSGCDIGDPMAGMLTGEADRTDALLTAVVPWYVVFRGDETETCEALGIPFEFATGST